MYNKTINLGGHHEHIFISEQKHDHEAHDHGASSKKHIKEDKN